MSQNLFKEELYDLIKSFKNQYEEHTVARKNTHLTSYISSQFKKIKEYVDSTNKSVEHINSLNKPNGLVIKDKLDSILNSLSELSNEQGFDLKKESIAIAEKYQELVLKHSKKEDVIYDLALTFYPRHDTSLNSLNSIIDNLNKMGTKIDILYDEKFELKKDEKIEYPSRAVGQITIVTTSSNFEKIMKSLSKNSFYGDIYADHILPRFDNEYSLEDCKNMLEDRIKKSDDIQGDVVHAYRMLGFQTSEMLKLSQSTPDSDNNYEYLLRNAISKSIASLPSMQSETHVNGVMPAGFKYDEDDDLSNIGVVNKKVNAFDDIRLQETNKNYINSVTLRNKPKINKP